MARFLSIDATADELCVGRSTIYRLVARGALPTVKIGKRQMIERAALEAFIASGGEAA